MKMKALIQVWWNLEIPFRFSHSTSSNIQNDLIEGVGKFLYDSIKREIEEAKFVAIIPDELTDIRNLSQLSTIIRYFKDRTVKERFIGFENVTGSRTADALFTIVDVRITSLNLW